VYDLAKRGKGKTVGKGFCRKIHLQVDELRVNDDLQVHGIGEKRRNDAANRARSALTSS
jgi:hypothetical protein